MHPVDAALTSGMTDKEFIFQQREHAQLLDLNRHVNPPHSIGGDISGGFALNLHGPPDPNRTTKHYEINNNYCWTRGYDVSDTQT